MTADWIREIDELHAFFEAYFLGSIPADDVSRFADALDPSFTIVNPNDGRVADRDATLAMVRDGYAHASDFTITCSDHRLLHATEATIIAEYVERHDWTDGRSNARLSTVVFAVDPTAPNGVRWVRVHETWLGRE